MLGKEGCWRVGGSGISYSGPNHENEEFKSKHVPVSRKNDCQKSQVAQGGFEVLFVKGASDGTSFHRQQEETSIFGTLPRYNYGPSLSTERGCLAIVATSFFTESKRWYMIQTCAILLRTSNTRCLIVIYNVYYIYHI
jgi:hypothetical protein